MKIYSNAAKPHRGLAIVSGALIASVVAFGVLVPQLSASASQEEYLMADYMQWNVVTYGDAYLQAESEGAVAVGGTLSFSGTNTATQHSTTDDDSGIGLLSNKVDLSNSSGQLKVLTGSIRIEDDTQIDVLNRDNNNAQIFTHVVAKNAGVNSSPSIVANNSREGSDTVVKSGLFASLFTQSAAESLAQQIAAYPQTDTQGAQAAVEIQGSKSTVTLSKGKTNYWPISADTLASLTEITFSGTTPKADDGTFLVIPISGSSVTFNLTLAGSRDPSAMLWVAADASSVVQSGDSLDGSLLAPKANLEKKSANIQGTIVVKSGTFGGSEQHYFPYKGKVPPVVPTKDPTDPVTPVITTTEPTTTEPTTTEPTTTEPTTTEPTTTEPTTTEPTTTEPTTTEPTTTDPTTTEPTTTHKNKTTSAEDTKKTSSLAKTGSGSAVVAAAIVFTVLTAVGTAGIAISRSRKHHRNQ
jgi:choice-of-anchor A domain-containing protein